MRLGGALTAVVVGLAAQQTLGNLFAGTLLLSARPFRVGERVQLQGGPLAGTVEGVVSSLGLLYTTLARGEDAIMVPNLARPQRGGGPAARAAGRRAAGAAAAGYHADRRRIHHCADAVRTPMRGPPNVTLEEVDGDDIVVRVRAAPERPSDGPQLASEALAAVTQLTPGPDLYGELSRPVRSSAGGSASTAREAAHGAHDRLRGEDRHDEQQLERDEEHGREEDEEDVEGARCRAVR